MGCVVGVGHEDYPAQSVYVGKPCRVLFLYSEPAHRGVVVRDDRTAPWETILRLDDGRHVRGTECQWSPWPADGEEG